MAEAAPMEPNPEESRSPELREAVLAMFQSGGPADVLTHDVREYVDEIISDYRRDAAKPARTDPAGLVEKFENFRIPELPGQPEQYLQYLRENVVRGSAHVVSPRFVGHMTSALPGFMRPAAELMTVLNQNPVKMETSGAFSPYEREALAMLHHQVFDMRDDFYQEHTQHPDATLGIMTSGGTIANITALWTARNSALAPRGDFRGVEKEGLAAALKEYGYEGAVIIGSELMHYSMEKAADLMGIGTVNLIKVPTRNDYGVDTELLRARMDECRSEKKLIIGLVGVAGSTDMGSIDDLPVLAGLAREAGAHFHVDAAWGGAVLFSGRFRSRLAGIELADSVTVDGHKQLYVPMGNGMVLFRDPGKARFIEKSAHYVIRAGSVDLGKRSLEGSRPAMALLLHTALNLIGRAGYEILIEDNIEKVAYLARVIRASDDFELLHEPRMNILLYRCVPAELRTGARAGTLTDEENRRVNRFNENLQKTVRNESNTFISRTTFNMHFEGGRRPVTALRAVIANPLTTRADIDTVIAEQRRIASKVASSS